MSEVFLIQHGRIEDGCHHQVESEWMNEGIFVQMVGTNPGKCEWVWEEKLRWLNPRWPYSKWLPSSSWVRMNKFQSDWISLSQESEWRESVFEWIWEKKTRCLNPTWQNSRWLPSSIESEWMSVAFFVQMVGTNLGKCEWVWEEKLRWLNPRWPNSKWLPSSSWVRMNEFESDWISLSQSFMLNGWIQDGRIQDASVLIQHGRIQDGCHHQVESNEWVKVFLYKWWEPILASVSEFERKN